MTHRHPILTFGHSDHSPERFRVLLQTQNIEVVLDVRSSPYSGRARQFNRPNMAQWLAAAGIRYLFAGRSLGGRPAEPSLYEHGRASYERMGQTTEFLSALRRIVAFSRHARCVLVCAEAEPLECHRFLLIGRVLSSRSVDVRHMLANGAVESHQAAEGRLIRLSGVAQSELFGAYGDALARAYALQEARVAFRPQSPDGTHPSVEWLP